MLLLLQNWLMSFSGTFHFYDFSFPPHQERMPYLSHTASKTSDALIFFLSTTLLNPNPFCKTCVDDPHGATGITGAMNLKRKKRRGEEFETC